MLQNTPQVVKNLIILNVLMFAATNLILSPELSTKLLGVYPGSPDFRPWQLLSHMFMHADLWHILFNMISLLVFGSRLEMIWGPQRFLSFYLICGFGGFFCHELVNGIELYRAFGSFFPIDDVIYGSLYGALTPPQIDAIGQASTRVLGASGAVYGLLLAYGVLFPNTELMLLFPPIPVKAKYLVLGLGLYALFAGLRDAEADFVAHFAHLGGMVFGYFLLKRWQQDRGHFY